jgi:hypothetical protein
VRLSKDFAKLYHTAAEASPGLFRLPEQRLEMLAATVAEERLENRTRDFSIIMVLLPFGYLFCAVAVALAFKISRNAVANLSMADLKRLVSVAPGLDYGLALFAMSGITYFLLLPLLRLIASKRLSGRSGLHILLDLDIRSRRLWMSGIPILYLASGIAIVLVVRQFQITDVHLRLVLQVWLLCALLPLAASPIVFTGFASLLIRRFSTRRHPTEPLVLDQALKCLIQLDRTPSLDATTFEERRWIASRLAELARSIEGLYPITSNSTRSDLWVSAQLRASADNVLALASWLLLPQESTLTAITRELTEVINAFLSGQWHYLPRREVGPGEGLLPSRRRRRLLYTGVLAFGVLVYAFGPLLAAIVLRAQLPNLEIPDSLLLLLYSLWLTIGLYIYIEHTVDDPKSLLIDLVKSALGR